MKVIAIHALWCIACLKTVPNLKETLKKYPYELEELDYDMDIDKVEKQVQILNAEGEAKDWETDTERQGGENGEAEGI